MERFRTAAAPWRAGLAGLVGVLYLGLTLAALTCALHHGLDAACPHQGAAHAAGPMPGHPGGEMPPAADASPGLCHCLDNLAAEAPSARLAAATPPPVAGITPPAASRPLAPPAGAARPRAPPTLA